MSPAYRLTFRLPPALILLAPAGRHHPCLHGCVLTVGRDGGVLLEGPSRERCFEQAGRFLRVLARGKPAFTIPAVLVTPAPRGRDGWSIVVGAEVSFAATAIAPTVPGLPANILAAG